MSIATIFMIIGVLSSAWISHREYITGNSTAGWLWGAGSSVLIMLFGFGLGLSACAS